MIEAYIFEWVDIGRRASTRQSSTSCNEWAGCQRFIVLGSTDGLTGTKIRDAEDDTERKEWMTDRWEASMFE